MPSQSLLPEVWSVPQEFRNRLGEEVGRQRAMLADGHGVHSPHLGLLRTKFRRDHL